MTKYFVTGDCHGQYKKLELFIKKQNQEDELFIFILGDVGLNWNLKYDLDDEKKKYLSRLKATFVCLRGNHDANHQKLNIYKQKKMFDGIVYYEDKYPNILFTKDGEVYTINSKKIFCCGGAYSVDKFYRLVHHYIWFADEQPQDEDKEYAKKRLYENDYNVDFIFTHTCPYFAIPKHLFLPGIDQNTVDNSTEIWLESLCDDGLEFKHWYCGHYHADAEYNGITFMFNDFLPIDL